MVFCLIERADVFAQNFRPGAIERLGFSAEVVMARNPKLLYLSINGVGETGPYASKRVYDPIIQALSGMAHIQADPTSGRPKMVRTLVADKITAIYAAQAVTAALVARGQSGAGQHVRISMLDAMLSYLWPEGMANYSVVEDGAQDIPATAHDMIFPTADGYVTFGAGSDANGAGTAPPWTSRNGSTIRASRHRRRGRPIARTPDPGRGEIAGRDQADVIAAWKPPTCPARRF